MNCQRVEKWLWQEGAGNIPSAAIDHASTCPDCRALIEQVRLLDRSVAGTPIPDPGDAYWDAMRERIALRIANPNGRVIEFVPYVPIWKRFIIRAWAPTMAVALLAVIASQRTLVVSPVHVAVNEDELRGRIAELSAPDNKATVQEVDQLVGSSASAERQIVPGAGAVASIPQNLPAEDASFQGQWVDRSYDPTTKKESPTTPPSTMPEAQPTIVVRDEVPSTSQDAVWPERQVTIMGDVDSNAPSEPATDDRRLAAQDPFGSYERQMAEAGQGLESLNTYATPGRLMDAPAASQARGPERMTPAEQMRRFDEIAELRELIARLESVPETSRAMSQWTQWTTAWYRLGMLSDHSPLLDSALVAVRHFQSSVPVDSVTGAEWQVRKSHLENRRADLQR